MLEIGLDRQRLLIGAGCLVVALEIPEHVAAAEPRLIEIGLDRERLVVGNEGVVEAGELLQAIALARICIGKVRIVECRLVELLDRLRIVLRGFGEDRASVVVRERIARIDRQCAREIGQRLLGPVEALERVSVIAQRFVAVAVQADRRLEMRLGLRKSALHQLDHAEEVGDVEDVRGGSPDLLEDFFRFRQVPGLKGLDSTPKFGLQLIRQAHSSLNSTR